ncbi:HIT domain-containing protein [Streptomyces fructofermentans]|uniref:HIT family protein n=1 Tax=Streptomyces fructofermentans TaxID=152141 RepID=UPI0033E98057
MPEAELHSPLPVPAPAPCVFCDIIAGRAPAEVVHEWDDVLAIVPLNPVTEGHLLVIPKVHVVDFGHDPRISAATMRRAAELAAEQWCNVITSRGRVATQTVFHLHVHIVPRREGDGLALPWTAQSA